jgi:DNA-binding FrmR family transcriptional regulator
MMVDVTKRTKLSERREPGKVSMKYDDKVMNRVKRMEGQLRGILRMMEEGKDCKEVITQLSAVRSGVDRAIGIVVSENLVECVMRAEGDSSRMNEMIQEAVNLLVKSR